MKCPNCNKEMHDNYCMVCGYMTNGNFVGEYVEFKNKDIKVFQKDFDVMNQNSNKILTLFLGPLYFSYKGNFLFGFIFLIIDILLFILSAYIFSIIPFTFPLTFLGVFIYILISRTFYMSFSNYICLRLDEIKISRYKRKYKESYANKLRNNKNHVSFIILDIVLCIFIYIFIKIVFN